MVQGRYLRWPRYLSELSYVILIATKMTKPDNLLIFGHCRATKNGVGQVRLPQVTPYAEKHCQESRRPIVQKFGFMQPAGARSATSSVVILYPLCSQLQTES